MRVERFTNGQSAYAEILAYDDNFNLYAYEATEADVLDLYVDSPVQVGTRVGSQYYVVTISERNIKWERVCKDVALNFALA